MAVPVLLSMFTGCKVMYVISTIKTFIIINATEKTQAAAAV